MGDDKTIVLSSLSPDTAASADVARFTNPAPAGVAATNVKIANPFVLQLSSMLAVATRGWIFRKNHMHEPWSISGLLILMSLLGLFVCCQPHV